jgi:anti-sigma B factor antagonist
MTMQVNREEIGSILVLAVEGSIDIASSPKLRGELRVALEAKRPRIVVDMKEVKFVDSSGLATLIEALKKSKDYGGHLTLCCLNSTVLGVFQLANLDSIFHIVESRDEALTD